MTNHNAVSSNYNVASLDASVAGYGEQPCQDPDVPCGGRAEGQDREDGAAAGEKGTP